MFGQVFGMSHAVVSASAVARHSDTQLVSDGDISPQGCGGICNYVAPNVVGTGPWMAINPPGVTSPAGNVDLQNCDGGTGQGCTLPAGVTSEEVVDLNGYNPGGIEQTISTEPDQNYELTFELTGNPFDNDDGYTFTGDVEINATITPFSWENPYPNVTFGEVQIPFVSTSTLTTIQFWSTSNRPGEQDYAGPEISEISILGPSDNLIR
jgi:hypothetical protein